MALWMRSKVNMFKQVSATANQVYLVIKYVYFYSYCTANTDNFLFSMLTIFILFIKFFGLTLNLILFIETIKNNAQNIENGLYIC